MSGQNKLPEKALNDPFKPPEPPRLVWCLHCENTYISSLMKWEGGLWCCGMPGCSGAGYGFDIFDAGNNPFQDEGEEELNLDGDFDVDRDVEFENGN